MHPEGGEINISEHSGAAGRRCDAIPAIAKQILDTIMDMPDGRSVMVSF